MIGVNLTADQATMARAPQYGCSCMLWPAASRPRQLGSSPRYNPYSGRRLTRVGVGRAGGAGRRKSHGRPARRDSSYSMCCRRRYRASGSRHCRSRRQPSRPNPCNRRSTGSPRMGGSSADTGRTAPTPVPRGTPHRRSQVPSMATTNDCPALLTLPCSSTATPPLRSGRSLGRRGRRWRRRH